MNNDGKCKGDQRSERDGDVHPIEQEGAPHASNVLLDKSQRPLRTTRSQHMQTKRRTCEATQLRERHYVAENNETR